MYVPTQNRPNRTSNGSYTPQRGSMSQTISPSMAQSSSPHSTATSTTTPTTTTSSNYQTNGLNYNNSSTFGMGEENEEAHDDDSHEDAINILNKSKLKSSGTALVIGEDLVSNENVSICFKDILFFGNLVSVQ